MIFATANQHKIEEVQKMLPDSIMLYTPAHYGITEEIPENEPTLQGNASSKAWYIYNKLGINCFADDTGLEVEALDGAPGVHSARYAPGDGHNSEDNIALLLHNLEGKSNRNARFRTIISLIIDGVEHQFEGVVRGTIRHEKSGTDGFGYDSVFEPTGYDITFAQMPLYQKNEISHRGRATAKLVEFLNR